MVVSGQLQLSTAVPPVSIAQHADFSPLPTRTQLRRQKSSSVLGIKPRFSDRLARSLLATRSKFLSYPPGFKERILVGTRTENANYYKNWQH